MRTEIQFWNWFQENQDRIYNFEDDTKAIFRELQQNLSTVHPDLTFEMGPLSHNIREFVISASGISHGFPAVAKLLNFAPSFSQFHLVPFRPRRDISNGISIGGIFLQPSQIGFHYTRQNRQLDIDIYIKGYDSHDVLFTQAVFTLLDSTIGEFDVENRLGHIGMHNFSENPQNEPCLPILELPHIVDSIKTGAY